MKNTNEQPFKKAYTPVEIQFVRIHDEDIINTSDPRSPFFGEDEPFYRQSNQKNDDKKDA